MLKSRLLRLLCAAALVASLCITTAPLQAAPLELPSVTGFMDLLGTWWVERSSTTHYSATGASEIYPSTNADGEPTQLTTGDTEPASETSSDGEGEAYPHADPWG